MKYFAIVLIAAGGYLVLCSFMNQLMAATSSKVSRYSHTQLEAGMALLTVGVIILV